MKKTLIFAIGTLISSMVLAATGGKPVVMKGATQTADGWSVKSGGYFSETMFEVDTSADYLLSGTFRGEPGAGNFNFGLQCFDSKKRNISGHSINPIEYTLTELVQAAVKGNDHIIVKDGSRWLASKGKIVMFNAQADLSDLPNYNQHYYLKSVEKHADGWKVTFDRPLKVNYPKACPVRLHGGGDWLCHIAYTTPTAEWKTFNVLITGEGVHQIRGNKFGYGTKFVKLALYTYPGKNVQFKDLALRKISPAEAQKLRNRANGPLMKDFKPTSLLSFSKADGEWSFKAYPWGGIAASDLNLQADKIKAIELDVSLASAPCKLMLFFSSIDSNGKVRKRRMDIDIPMDKKYHTVQFPVADCAEWQGAIKSIEFRCDSNDPVDMKLRDLNFLSERNLIEGASKFAPGNARIVRNLWPRGKYTLRWSGEANPGATLKISDRHGNLLESVELPAGSKEGVTFTVPYNGVQNTLTVNGEGKGHIALDLVQWKKNYTPEGKMIGSWIWCQDAPGPEHTYVWFKRDIQLDAPVDQALMALAVDDSFDLYINGKFVGHGYPFTSTFRYDIAPYLKTGKNEILIRTFNGSSWGGALLNGFIRAGQQNITLASDENYLFATGTKDAPQGEFKPAVVLGPANTTEPWTGRVEFRYIGEMGEMEILDNSTFGSFKAQVKHIPVIKRDRMNFKLVSDSGKVIQLDLRVKIEPADYKVGDTVTVTYAKPPIMLESYKITAFDDYIKLSGKDNIAGTVPAFRGAEPGLAKAQLINADTIPALLINGKQMNPFFWQIEMQNFQANHGQIMGDALATGCKIVNIQLLLDQTLKQDNTLDFRIFEQRVATVLSENPDAYLMANVYLCMPEWWLNAHPGNRTINEKGQKISSGYNTALSSLKWRQAACRFLKEFAAYVQKQPWGNRFIGTTFCNSRNSEWFWETSSAWGLQGYCQASQDSYRQFLQNKYKNNTALQKAWHDSKVTFASVTLPSSQMVKSASCGTLLDPVKDQQISDFFEWRNLILAEQIIAFGQAVKEATGNRWLTGAYYGYTIEFASSNGRPIQDHGHNGIIEVARSPYVDFVRGISRYALRGHGAPDGIMQSQDTFKLRGKMVYLENDFRCYYATEPDARYGRHKYPFDSVGALNRTFAMMLATGTSLYYLDLVHSFHEPIFREIAAEQLKILYSLPPVQGLTPYECALVTSRDSAYYTKRIHHDSIIGQSVGFAARNFNTLAIPYRSLTVEDLLEDGVVPPQKLYIMTSGIMLAKEQRQKLLQRFEREKAVVVWLYAAGCTYPGMTPSAEATADFLGIKTVMDKTQKRQQMFYGNKQHWHPTVKSGPWFYPVSGFDEVLGKNEKGQPVLVRKNLRGATHYYTSMPSLPMDLLADFAQQAGVHRYNATAQDQYWIGNDYVSIHAVVSGEKSFDLPAGTQLVSIYGPVKGKYQSGEKFFLHAGQTAIFRSEKKK